MSCFGCCEEDEFHKAAESGGPYVVKNPAGNFTHVASRSASGIIYIVCNTEQFMFFLWYFYLD
jgi:hypothetical protein